MEHPEDNTTEKRGSARRSAITSYLCSCRGSATSSHQWCFLIGSYPTTFPFRHPKGLPSHPICRRYDSSPTCMSDPSNTYQRHSIGLCHIDQPEDQFPQIHPHTHQLCIWYLSRACQYLWLRHWENATHLSWSAPWDYKTHGSGPYAASLYCGKKTVNHPQHDIIWWQIVST